MRPGSFRLPSWGSLMKRVWHEIVGVLLDLGCAYAGFMVAAVSAVVDYGSDTRLPFWGFRLLFSTLPVVFIAWLSAYVRHERAWRCWLRFALFGGTTFAFAVVSVGYMVKGDFRYAGLFLPAVLLDTAVCWAVLNAPRFRRRGGVTRAGTP